MSAATGPETGPQTGDAGARREYPLTHARGRHHPLRREPHAAGARRARPRRARDAASPLRARPLARAPRRPGDHCGRRPRQAPLPALRRRPDDPLAPAHDGLLADPPAWRRAFPPLAPHLARAASRRGRGAPARRPRARADDGRARPLRSAHRRPRARHPRPRVRPRALPAPPARRRPHAADRRRAARPAHGGGHRQPVEGRGLLRGGHRPVAGDRRGLLHARDGNQTRHRRIYGRAGVACPRCRDASRIEVRGQWEDNRPTFWCPRCQT